MAERSHSRRLLPGVAATLLLAGLAPTAVPALQRADGVQVAPPPRPAENFVRMTEAEILAKLPAAERHLVESESEPRERFQAMLDVSDVRLADVGARLDAGAPTVLPELLLYEAVIRLADDALRSPAARVPIRDKLFKRFERRLGRQLAILKLYESEYRPDDSATGLAVTARITTIRTNALHSALGVEMLETPPE